MKSDDKFKKSNHELISSHYTMTAASSSLNKKIHKQ